MNVQVSLAAAMLLVAALVGLGWLAAWWDSQLRRRRWVVGEVGIGIKADTPYRCEDGRLVEVER